MYKNNKCTCNSPIDNLINFVYTQGTCILSTLAYFCLELMSLKQQTEKLVSEKNSLKQKAEGYLVDYEQEKQEKFELKVS